MSYLSHIIKTEHDGCTVRDVLTAQWHISSSQRKLLRRRPGALLLNGKATPVSAIVHTGDLLQADVSDPPGTVSTVQPVDFPLSVLWEDEHLLAINKPAGVTVHGAALTAETVTIAGAAAHYLGSPAVHVVNRLDRGTSGVMLIAKSAYMHSRCMELLHTKALYREYRAVCDGVPVPPQDVIDAPIARDAASLLRRCVDPTGLAAVTEYEVLQTANGRALLRLVPRTGRTHQLRVHMAAVGHPLTGDWLYGTEDRTLITRPALHSHILHFIHPLTGQIRHITAPLPEDLLQLL